MGSLQRYLPLSSLLFLILLTCTRDNSNQVVATIDNFHMTLPYFTYRYGEFLRNTNLQDNLQTRHTFLEILFDEHLLLQWADRSGMKNRSPHQNAMRDLDEQILLNLLYESRIGARINISEEELRRLFRWSKMRIHTRHLYARDREAAERLYERLMSGESWDSLAKETFQDPVLAQNGGDLGFWELGDMDPSFEMVAFELEDGEVSPPTMTKKGFSIIQLIEREVDPFVIEQEFHMRKTWLKQIAYSYKKYPRVRAHTDSVMENLSTEFSDNGVSEVWQQIDKIHSKDEEISIQGGQLPCVRFKGSGGVWTVSRTIAALRYLSDRQKRLVQSREDLKTVISGLIIQEHLIKEARRLGFDSTDKFKKESLHARNSYLISKVIDLVVNLEKGPGYQARRNNFIAFRNDLREKVKISIDREVIRDFVLD